MATRKRQKGNQNTTQKTKYLKSLNQLQTGGERGRSEKMGYTQEDVK